MDVLDGAVRQPLDETMTPERAELPIVVVSEGLAFDMATRRALTAPSFVGEAVLSLFLIAVPPAAS